MISHSYALGLAKEAGGGGQGVMGWGGAEVGGEDEFISEILPEAYL